MQCDGGPVRLSGAGDYPGFPGPPGACRRGHHRDTDVAGRRRRVGRRAELWGIATLDRIRPSHMAVAGRDLAVRAADPGHIPWGWTDMLCGGLNCDQLRCDRLYGAPGFVPAVAVPAPAPRPDERHHPLHHVGHYPAWGATRRRPWQLAWQSGRAVGLRHRDLPGADLASRFAAATDARYRINPRRVRPSSGSRHELIMVRFRTLFGPWRIRKRSFRPVTVASNHAAISPSGRRS